MLAILAPVTSSPMLAGHSTSAVAIKLNFALSSVKVCLSSLCPVATLVYVTLAMRWCLTVVILTATLHFSLAKRCYFVCGFATLL